MRPNARLFALVAVLAATLGVSAQAATLTSVSPFNATIVDLSSSGLAKLDIDYAFDDDSEFTVSFQLDAAEASAGFLDFNAVLRNHMSFPFWDAGIRMNGSATIATPYGSVYGATRPFTSTFATAYELGGVFDPARVQPYLGETSTAYLGNPLADGTHSNIRLLFSGKQAGDLITFAVVVPEPSEWAFALAGLASLALVARRRRAGGSAGGL